MALRRLAAASIAVFLQDSDPSVVLEAARAIHDLPISEAMEALAEATNKINSHPETGRRILNANFRLGTQQQANLLAQVAADAQTTELLRALAVDFLANWEAPSNRDNVLGFWRPLESRNVNIARNAMILHLGGILAGTDQFEPLASRPQQSWESRSWPHSLQRAK